MEFKIVVGDKDLVMASEIEKKLSKQFGQEVKVKIIRESEIEFIKEDN